MQPPFYSGLMIF